MAYESLIAEYENNIEIVEIDMSIKGLYADGIIGLRRDLTSIEKNCILAEEIGHHVTTYGDILDQSKIDNFKQENRAHRWAHHKLISIESLIECFENGIQNRYECAEYLNVTDTFLENCINSYINIYGQFIIYKDYAIYFEPFGMMRLIQNIEK